MSLKSAITGKWAFVCGAAVGVLVAFPLAAPVFDGKILEPVATMWGSALGAIAAVAGAAWVADRQATQQKRSGAALVAAMIHPVAAALADLATMYGQPSRPDQGESNDEPDIISAKDWESCSVQAWLVVDRYKDFQRKIHRFETGLNLLSAAGLEAALAIESTLEDGIKTAVHPLCNQNGEDPVYGHGHGFKSASPTWSSRSVLATLAQDIQKFMAQLKHESS